MNGIFRFKQFHVAQDRCAMKIGTDGVLLGALTEVSGASRILDAGCGTGLIALMLAQRNASAEIDAIDTDEEAAFQAAENFAASPWSERLRALPLSFEELATDPSKHGNYDLLVSNPPYFTDSLKAPDERRTLARHASAGLLNSWAQIAALLLKPAGLFYVILPAAEAEAIIGMCRKSRLHLHREITIRSFAEGAIKRRVLAFGFQSIELQKQDLVIYKSPGNYSDQYIFLLKDFILKF